MKLINSVAEILDTLDIGCTICLAVSGGPDSMCMLAQVIEYYRIHSYPLSQIHVLSIDHGVREESVQEVEGVRLFVSSYPEIVFHSTRLDPQDDREETLRNLRRDYIHQVMQEVSGYRVLTGHNLTDRMETLLLNLCRGAHITGMTTLSPDDGYIVRPLIHLAKHETQARCDTYQIPYRQDPSNQDPSTSLRNRLRKEILEPYYQIADRINGRKVLYRSIDTLFDILTSYAQEHHQTYVFKHSQLSPYHSHNVCIQCLDYLRIQDSSDLYDLLQQLGYAQHSSQAFLQELLQRIKSSRSGQICIADMICYKSHACLYMLTGRNPNILMPDSSISVKIDHLGQLRFGAYEIMITDPAYLGQRLRFHRPGDTLHHKTIHKHLINRRVPIFWRPYIPVIVDVDDQVREIYTQLLQMYDVAPSVEVLAKMKCSL